MNDNMLDIKKMSSLARASSTSIRVEQKQGDDYPVFEVAQDNF